MVQVMLQEVGVAVVANRIMWVKTRPDYEPLFSILDGLRPYAKRHYWIECLEAQKDNCDIVADTGQVSTGVKISLPISHNT